MTMALEFGIEPTPLPGTKLVQSWSSFALFREPDVGETA